MHDERRHFDVSPKIVRADSEATIVIRPLFEHCRFRDGGDYEVRAHPTDWSLRDDGHASGEPLRLRPHDGALHVRHRFEAEQEHVVVVEEASAEENERVAAFRVYSLADDLFGRRPYKGDFHLHSDRSDGRESPGYVAAACRRIGLDFMALTDHRLYAPSLEAMRAFESVDADLRIYPGEEVHPPDTAIHIVNFGGSFSLNELFASDETYPDQVRAIQDSAGELLPGVDRREYASSVWCFRKIREAGGLGVFCHPYWFTNDRYYVSEALTTQLLEDQPHDALEVIGGYHRHEVESNALQVARYYEERARGREVPIVGASDAHGCERGELFGWYYTIVFAPSPSLADLIGSVKDLYSVAVEALPNEAARAYGPFRLVKYAHFLMREVLPAHDEICMEEGRMMLAHLAGEPGAAEALSRSKGRAAALYDHLWAAP